MLSPRFHVPRPHRASNCRARIVVDQLEDRLTPATSLVELPLVTTVGSDSLTRIATPEIHKGDIVEVTATLTSTDPDENGEDEPLVIDGSGGYHAALGTYNQATPLRPGAGNVDYHARKDGEVFVGYLRGFDSDESAQVQVSIINAVTGMRQRFSPAQKAEFARDSARLNTQAASDAKLGAALAALAIPPGPQQPYFLAASAFAFYQSGDEWEVSGKLNELALDPPDPNFRSVAAPLTPGLTRSQAGPGVTHAEADAFNALFANQNQALGLAQALVTAINRASGAAVAHNLNAEAMQLKAAASFATHLSSLFSAQPALRTNVVTALKAAGINNITFSPADINSFQQDVAAQGLPAGLTSALQSLGADTTELSRVMQLLIVQDNNAAAGTFPDKLADSTLLAGLTTLSSSFTVDTTPASPHDVSRSVRLKLRGLHASGHTLRITLSLQNPGRHALEGPIVLVFNRQLGRDVKLLKIDGHTTDGRAFIGVPLDATGALGAGQAVSVTFQLRIGAALKFNALPKVFQGVF